jgi:hypothetical protein
LTDDLDGTIDRSQRIRRQNGRGILRISGLIESFVADGICVRLAVPVPWFEPPVRWYDIFIRIWFCIGGSVLSSVIERSSSKLPRAHTDGRWTLCSPT